MADTDITPAEEEVLKEKSKKISIREACSYSFMDGFGMRYITPFAVAIGKNNPHLNTYVGFLTSIPSLLGNLSQLLTVRAMNKNISRKKLVFWGVFLQALMWLPLILMSYWYYSNGPSSSLSLSSLVFIYTLMIIFGAFAGPAWSSIMKQTVTGNIGTYFGKRSRIAGFIALACMLVAGFILDYYENTSVFIGFTIIFTVAFFGRLGSAYLFMKQYEPQFKPQIECYFSFTQFLKKMASNNFGKFTIFYALVSLTTAIASPFFAVYMLKDLNFSYLLYMAIIIIPSITSLLTMSAWGKFADAYGNLRVMRICGRFIFILPILWAISIFLTGNRILLLVYLFTLEIFSGFIWAGFNLSAGNFIYEAVTKEKIAMCVSYFSVLAGFGVFIGASLGGFLSSSNIGFSSFTPVLVVFLISGISRLIIYLIMMPKIKEVRPVEHFQDEGLLSIGKFFSSNLISSINFDILRPRWFHH